MVTGLGLASVICGGLAAVLWIPAIWVPWISIIGLAAAIAAGVLGYFGNKQFEQRCAYMQQQAAAYGQPFRKPFNFSKLGLLLAGIGGGMNLICFMHWLTFVPYARFIGSRI